MRRRVQIGQHIGAIEFQDRGRYADLVTDDVRGRLTLTPDELDALAAAAAQAADDCRARIAVAEAREAKR